MTFRFLVFVAMILSIETASAQKFYLFVGTYTGGNSKGIYVYQFDAKTGSLKWLSNTDSVSNPSYLAVDRQGRYVYAVNEDAGKQGGSVSAFAFNRSNSSLSFINRQPSGGDHPCYVAVTADGGRLVAGNYSGGNFSVFAVNKDGSIAPPLQTVQHVGSSVNAERQEKAHVHATVFSPRENFLLVPDLGIDQVLVYPFNASSSLPVDTGRRFSSVSQPGSGPRHLAFHPGGSLVYLMEELTGTVAAYRFSGGRLHFLQRLSSHPPGYRGTKGSADIHVSPDGRFLYASNRGDANNLAIFSVSPGGRLKPVGFQSTGGLKPRNFVIDPTGNYLLVANQDSHSIVVFKRNKKTGLLQQAGTPVSVPSPVCLKMLR